MSDLNLDVVALVLSRLSPHERFSLQRVSKTWKQAALIPLACNLTFATQQLKGGSRATQVPQAILERHIYPHIKTLLMNGYPPNLVPLWPPKTLKLPSVECIEYSIEPYMPTFVRLITEAITAERLTRIANLNVGGLWNEESKVEFLRTMAVTKNLRYLSINGDEPTSMVALLSGVLPNLQQAIMKNTRVDASMLLPALQKMTSASSLRSLEINFWTPSFESLSQCLSCLPSLEEATLDIRTKDAEAKSHVLSSKSLKRLTVTPNRTREFGVACEELEYLKITSPSQYGDESGPTSQIHLFTPKLLELDITAPGLWNIDYAGGSLATYPPNLKRLHISNTNVMMCDGPVTSIAESCPNLAWLQIDSCPIFCNLSLAHPLLHLRYLEISRCSDFTNLIIDEFEMFPKLECLIMHNNPKLSYLAFEEDTKSVFPSLHTIDVDNSPKLPLEQLCQFVHACPQLRTLKTAKYPQKLISMVASKIGAERAEGLKITGPHLGDNIWNAKYGIFNKSSKK